MHSGILRVREETQMRITGSNTVVRVDTQDSSKRKSHEITTESDGKVVGMQRKFKHPLPQPVSPAW